MGAKSGDYAVNISIKAGHNSNRRSGKAVAQGFTNPQAKHLEAHGDNRKYRSTYPGRGPIRVG